VRLSVGCSDEVLPIRRLVNQDACDDEREGRRSRNMEGAYPVKGMGDLETEEIIDTDMVRGSGRVCIARLDFEVGKRGHRVVIEYVDV